MKKVYNQPIVITDACIEGLISFMSNTVPHNPDDSNLPGWQDTQAPERKAF